MASTDVLDPYASEWLEYEKLNGGRVVFSGGVDNIRRNFNRFFRSLREKLNPPSDAVSIKDFHLTEQGPRVRVYIPKDAAKATLPCGLYIHSGGFVAGSIENEDHVAREIAERVPIILVSTSYRLAPEHPFPAALEDCTTSYKWLKQNAAAFGANPDRVMIMGGSAGANLAAATALSFVRDPAYKPYGLVLICSSTVHPDVIPQEYRHIWCPARYADAALLSRDGMMTSIDAYAAPPSNTSCSILLHPDLGQLPRTWLVACTKDPTYDEMRMLGEKLKSLNAPVELTIVHGYPHFFWMIPMLDRQHRFMKELEAQLQNMVA